jgi:plastocyanin
MWMWEWVFFFSACVMPGLLFGAFSPPVFLWVAAVCGECQLSRIVIAFLCCLTIALLLICPWASFTQQPGVTGRIELTGTTGQGSRDFSGGVVWLSPVGETKDKVPAAPRRLQQLVQHHKAFSPHLLIVQVGSSVEFPNRDPFFHNVFSLFEGKRFDLGLYESGSSRTLVFDRVGICYIFCNIHSEMSAVIVVLNTPYYAISDRRGDVNLANVVPGVYELHVWHERASPEVLNALTRKVTITGPSSLGVLRVPEQASTLQAHKNKYGQDYDPPSPDSPLYSHP